MISADTLVDNAHLALGLRLASFPPPPDGYTAERLLCVYMYMIRLHMAGGMTVREARAFLQKEGMGQELTVAIAWLRSGGMPVHLPAIDVDDKDAVRPDIIRLTGNSHWSLFKGVVRAKIAGIQADARAWEQYGYYDLPTGSNTVKNGDPAQFIDIWLAVVEARYKHSFSVKAAIDYVAEDREMKSSRVSRYWYASDKWLEAHRPLFYLQVQADLYNLDRYNDYYLPLRGHLAKVDYVESGAPWKMKPYNKGIKSAYGKVNKRVKDRIGKSMIKYHNDGPTPRNPTMAEILRDKGLTIDEAYDFSAFDTPERAYHWRMYCDHTPLPDDVMKALL